MSMWPYSNSFPAPMDGADDNDALSRVKRLEREIKRHHLGQRGGKVARVGIDGMQHLAAPGLDHDRGIARLGRSRAQQPDPAAQHQDD